MKVKLTDVARQAGVSEATVSLVLNRRPGVNAKTRAKVLAVAKELGYTPNSIARNLATRRSHTVGLIVTDICNPFFGTLTHHIDHFVKREKFSLILSLSDDDLKKEDAIIDDFIGRMVEGIIIVPALRTPRVNFKAFDRLKARSIPYVFVSSFHPKHAADYVMADLTQGSYHLAQHLIRSGVTRIRFLGVEDSEVVPVASRLRGIRFAMEEAGLTWKDDVLIPCSDATFESGYRSMKHALRHEEIPDAVMAMNDIMALGAVRAASNEGLRVPQDIAIAGYDDVVFSQISTVPLTTVRQDIEEMCKQAVSRLFDRIRDTDGDPIDPVHDLIETTLVIRESTNRGT
jgi:LacI family transcriptional regulator